MLNKGRRFIREFDTISDINDFCSKYSCVPINIIPVVVKTTYKAVGATSALNTMIPKYSYATILQPVEDGLTYNEIEAEIAAVDNGASSSSVNKAVESGRAVANVGAVANARVVNKSKDARPTRIDNDDDAEYDTTDTSKIADIINEAGRKLIYSDSSGSSGSEVDRLLSIGKANPNEELCLDNIDYRKIAEELHYDAQDKKRSKQWFMEHKHRPLSSYVRHMNLLPWQENLLVVMACNPRDYK